MMAFQRFGERGHGSPFVGSLSPGSSAIPHLDLGTVDPEAALEIPVQKFLICVPWDTGLAGC